MAPVGTVLYNDVRPHWSLIKEGKTPEIAQNKTPKSVKYLDFVAWTGFGPSFRFVCCLLIVCDKIYRWLQGQVCNPEDWAGEAARYFRCHLN